MSTGSFARVPTIPCPHCAGTGSAPATVKPLSAAQLAFVRFHLSRGYNWPPAPGDPRLAGLPGASAGRHLVPLHVLAGMLSIGEARWSTRTAQNWLAGPEAGGTKVHPLAARKARQLYRRARWGGTTHRGQRVWRLPPLAPSWEKSRWTAWKRYLSSLTPRERADVLEALGLSRPEPGTRVIEMIPPCPIRPIQRSAR